MAHYILALVLLFTVASHQASASLGRIQVDPDNHWFVDEFGRVRIFHGVNAVNKGFPWYPPYILEQSRHDDLEMFGFNIVRLGSMWSGAEPNEGEFNGTYISILRDIIEGLEEVGVYTILDMHQDVLSSATGSYDGIPLWLYEQFPPPTNPYPWPLDSVDQWEQGYLTQATSEGFQYLYNNTAEALNKWANFWQVMATNFKDDPAVLGYNYINEPWLGDYFENPDLLRSGVAGRDNLLPSYDVITEEIRKIDEKGIIFYEPVFYGQYRIGDGDLWGSGFDRVPGGWENADRSAFSWHAYCWHLEFIASNATDEERAEARQRCEDDLVPRFFESQAENVNETGGAAILTEFGQCDWQRYDVEMRCETFLALADEYMQSWCEWDYHWLWYDSNGDINWYKVLSHVRTYARAIAGTPQSMFFNATSNYFTLNYEINPDIEAPTEIFVPSEIRYENGFEVKVTDNVEYEVQGNLVFVWPVDSSENLEAVVSIEPVLNLK